MVLFIIPVFIIIKMLKDHKGPSVMAHALEARLEEAMFSFCPALALASSPTELGCFTRKPGLQGWATSRPHSNQLADISHQKSE